ncbi:unnamed protein product [Allacma fusca]|uniref:Mucin-like domain-containing protein n=1 Tax=Allacma fusca TaxID=39272 RepID=A0A8J2KBG0_9HEXA|nr:unnamed protein product [Allacma fusca]
MKHQPFWSVLLLFVKAVSIAQTEQQVPGWTDWKDNFLSGPGANDEIYKDSSVNIEVTAGGSASKRSIGGEISGWTNNNNNGNQQLSGYGGTQSSFINNGNNPTSSTVQTQKFSGGIASAGYAQQIKDDKDCKRFSLKGDAGISGYGVPEGTNDVSQNVLAPGVQLQTGYGLPTAPSNTGYGDSATSIGSGYGIAQQNTGYGNPSSQTGTGYVVPATPPNSGFSVLGTQSTTGYGVPSAQTSTEYGVPANQPNTGYGVQGTQSNSGYGVPVNQPNSGFGVSGTESNTGYTAPAAQPNFGYGVSGSQSNTGYGVPATQPNVGYGVPATQPNTGYGVPGAEPNSGYGVPGAQPNSGYNAPGTQPNAAYGVPGAQPNTGFGVPVTQPSTTYGVPGAQPNTGYGVPVTQPSTTYGVPGAQPNTGYGVPATQPNSGYGVPATQPNSGYGVPATQPNSGYGVPATQPNSGYGVPATQPNSGYGVPATQPNSGYGVPATQPNNGYGVPGVQPNIGYNAPATQPNAAYGVPGVQPSSGYGAPAVQTNSGDGVPGTQPISAYGTPATQGSTGYSGSSDASIGGVVGQGANKNNIPASPNSNSWRPVPRGYTGDSDVVIGNKPNNAYSSQSNSLADVSEGAHGKGRNIGTNNAQDNTGNVRKETDEDVPSVDQNDFQDENLNTKGTTYKQINKNIAKNQSPLPNQKPQQFDKSVPEADDRPVFDSDPTGSLGGVAVGPDAGNIRKEEVTSKGNAAIGPVAKQNSFPRNEAAPPQVGVPASANQIGVSNGNENPVYAAPVQSGGGNRLDNGNNGYPSNSGAFRPGPSQTNGYGNSGYTAPSAGNNNIGGYGQGHSSSTGNTNGFGNGGSGQDYSGFVSNTNKFNGGISAGSNGNGWSGSNGSPSGFSNGPSAGGYGSSSQNNQNEFNNGIGQGGYGGGHTNSNNNQNDFSSGFQSGGYSEGWSNSQDSSNTFNSGSPSSGDSDSWSNSGGSSNAFGSSNGWSNSGGSSNAFGSSNAVNGWSNSGGSANTFGSSSGGNGWSSSGGSSNAFSSSNGENGWSNSGGSSSAFGSSNTENDWSNSGGGSNAFGSSNGENGWSNSGGGSNAFGSANGENGWSNSGGSSNAFGSSSGGNGWSSSGGNSNAFGSSNGENGWSNSGGSSNAFGSSSSGNGWSSSGGSSNAFSSSIGGNGWSGSSGAFNNNNFEESVGSGWGHDRRPRPRHISKFKKLGNAWKRLIRRIFLKEGKKWQECHIDMKRNPLLWSLLLIFLKAFSLEGAEDQQTPGWTYWPENYFNVGGTRDNPFSIGALPNNEISPGGNGKITYKRSVGPGYQNNELAEESAGKQHQISGIPGAQTNCVGCSHPIANPNMKMITKTLISGSGMEGGAQGATGVQGQGTGSPAGDLNFSSQNLSAPKDIPNYGFATTPAGKGSVLELRSSSILSQILLPPAFRDFNNNSFQNTQGGSSYIDSTIKVGSTQVVPPAHQGINNSVSGGNHGNNNGVPDVLQSSSFAARQGVPGLGSPILQSSNNNGLQQSPVGSNFGGPMSSQAGMNNGVLIPQGSLNNENLIPQSSIKNGALTPQSGLQNNIVPFHGEADKLQMDLDEFVKNVVKCLSKALGCQDLVRNVTGRAGDVNRRQMANGGSGGGPTSDFFLEGPWTGGPGTTTGQKPSIEELLRIAQNLQSRGSPFQINPNEFQGTDPEVLGGVSGRLLSDRGNDGVGMAEDLNTIGRGIRGTRSHDDPNQIEISTGLSVPVYDQGITPGGGLSSENNAYSPDIKITKAITHGPIGYGITEQFEPPGVTSDVNIYSEGYQSPGDSAAGLGFSSGGPGEGYSSPPDNSNGFNSPYASGSNDESWPSLDSYPKPLDNGAAGSSYGWSKPSDGSDSFSSGYSSGRPSEGWSNSNDGWNEAKFSTASPAGVGWPGDSDGWKTVNYEVTEGPGWEQGRRPKPPPHILKLKSLGNAWVRLIRRIFLKEGSQW